MTLVGVDLLAPAAGCNCRVCPFHIGNPRAAEPICSGRNAGCSYCGCAQAEGAAHSGACRQCPVRCGSRVDIHDWMADVGGTLLFDDIPAPAAPPDGLPGFVPAVDGVATTLDAQAEWPAYAITMRRVYSQRTGSLKAMWRKEGDARQILRIPDDRLVVLSGYGEDPLVESFWTHRRDVYPALAEKRFDLVLAPNFSMYGNQPRTEHLLNFRRNLMVAAEMVAAGIPAVPNLYWLRKEDLDRYLAWVDDVEPAALAINLQTFRHESDDWQGIVLPGLSYLAATLPGHIRIVLNGTVTPERIDHLLTLFDRRQVVFVSQRQIQMARHGEAMRPDGTTEQIFARPEDAFGISVRNTAALIDTLASAHTEGDQP